TWAMMAMFLISIVVGWQIKNITPRRRHGVLSTRYSVISMMLLGMIFFINFSSYLRIQEMANIVNQTCFNKKIVI
ncbi:MAG: hypothetical protein AAB670_01305, partial [Patescibacteria group bacterium]